MECLPRVGPIVALAATVVLLLSPATTRAAVDDDVAFLLRSASGVHRERVVCGGATPPWTSAIASMRGTLRFEDAGPPRRRSWRRVRDLLVARATYGRSERAFAPGWPYASEDAPVACLRLDTPDGPVRLLFLLDEGCAQVLVEGAARGVLRFPDAVEELAPLLGVRAPAARPSAQVAPAPPTRPFDPSQFRPPVSASEQAPAAPAPLAGPCPIDSSAPPVPDRLPEAVTKVPPMYPDEARERGVDGTVMVEALVDCDGRVADARVVESIPLLDEQALTAVRKWTFRPGVTDGRLARVWITLPIRFTLR